MTGRHSVIVEPLPRPADAGAAVAREGDPKGVVVQFVGGHEFEVAPEEVISCSPCVGCETGGRPPRFNDAVFSAGGTPLARPADAGARVALDGDPKGVVVQLGRGHELEVALEGVISCSPCVGCGTGGRPPRFNDAVFSAGGPPPGCRPRANPNSSDGEGSVLRVIVMADIILPIEPL